MDMSNHSQVAAAAQIAEVTTLPLSALFVGSHNVRTTPGLMPIPELAESIFTLDLLQNLIVTPKKGKKKGHTHSIVAGQRRYQALMLLCEQGRIASDHAVPVKIETDDTRITAMSLAENFAREGMHIADELAAMAKLDKEGKTLEQIANALGMSVLAARRRLKLLAVSPTLVALLQTDEITVDQLAALAISDSHAEQERVWSVASEWQREPERLRRALTREEVDASDDPCAKFVGIHAYEAAGGTVRRDLFSDDESGYLSDSVLLRELVLRKLEAEAQAHRDAGWAWVETRLSFDHSEFSRYGRLTAPEIAPSPEVAAQLENLQDELNTVQQEYDDNEDEDRTDPMLEKMEALELRIADLEDQFITAWTPEQRAAAGVVLFVDHEGKLGAREGLVEPKARPATEDGEPMKLTDQYGREKTSKAKPVHSDKLTRHLTAHRTVAVQSVLTTRPDVALAVLTAKLAIDVFQNDYNRSALDVRGTESGHSLACAANDMEGSKAWADIEAQREAWRKEMPKQAADMLPWVLSLEWDKASRLMAFCVAVHVTGLRDSESAAAPMDALAAALNLDMADHWQATATSYFGRISKAQIVAAVTEAVDAKAAASLEGMKKDAAAAEAERITQGVRWVPEPMRMRAVKAPKGKKTK